MRLFLGLHVCDPCTVLTCAAPVMCLPITVRFDLVCVCLCLFPNVSGLAAHLRRVFSQDQTAPQ